MSDPFWDDLNKALPRARRGEAGWAHQRAQVLALVRGGRAPRRAAGVLAAGLAAAALVLVFRHKPAAPPEAPSAAMPAEDLDFLESAPLLEHLDELEDAPELDHA
ncbi:MAG: hypothetical protein HY923_01150 [Elusimicrobia bacterium]|nr:hypothetical protein [Elusimicrobiota bacterium]